MTILPRFVHRAYAAFMGYFWLPCPLCGECFGGHEWTNHDGMPADDGMTSGICNDCARQRALPCGCPPGKKAFGFEMHYPECKNHLGGHWQQ